MNRKTPCCEAEAMRRIRQIYVGDIAVGISMLEQIFEDVADADLPQDMKIRSELLRQVKIYNYVPKAAEDAYADAVFAEFQKEKQRK